MPSRAPDWLTAAPVAHRGLHDAARGIVESTPSAFSAAISGGFAIETDLQLSSDGEAMVFHDDTLTRLTERSDDIRTLSAAELKTVRYKDTTDRMITLGDLCDMTNGRVPLVVEIKSRFDGDRRLIRRIAEIVRAYQGPLALMSFDPDQVLAILGEGASLYGIQGLWSAAHYRLPVTFVICNNSQYQILKAGARGLKLPAAAAGKFVGMDLREPTIDMVKLAESFGVRAQRVTEPDELSSLVAESLAGNEPRLFDVTIAPSLAGPG